MKVALVTGSEGGIGGAVVRAFADAGYTVVGADLVPAAEVVVDVATEAGARRAVDAAVEQHGRLDAVVTAHGISGRSLGDGPVSECTDDAWNAVLAANLTSVFLVCRAAVPRLVDSGGGAIVMIGSVLGLVGDEDFATHAYAASKAALVGLCRAMAVHYAPSGIRANVVAPGLIETPMSRRAQDDPGIRSRLRELQPLTGTLGHPKHVAEAALYAARAEFVTGTVLVVDGGWTAR